ncbi:hypothetical protein [Lacticaseibacillus songhuajiangensis]|jgi:hypothetical protein|uniref:hypothetical protein n=1 Tax=Lacticaseibacillus songhuajiangensis TaxID=1296539 RepID=UPI000F7B3CD2|nr:hypothetical protein [Lacticaseibacillus songhuajiangensis]
MSKKSVLFAFAAGAAATVLLQHVHIDLSIAAKRKVAPGTPEDSVVPAPTVSQRVPRPGRPRPQMKTAGTKHPAKRVH